MIFHGLPDPRLATGGRFYGSRSGECLQHGPALGTGQGPAWDQDAGV